MSDWKNDPRLKHMDPKKLAILEDFSDRVKVTPKAKMIPVLLSLNMEAQSKGISFNDAETEVIVSILAADMPASEKKKIDTLKMFSRQLSMKQNR